MTVGMVVFSFKGEELVLFPCTVFAEANHGHRYEVSFADAGVPVAVYCIIGKDRRRLTWKRGGKASISANCAINAAYNKFPALKAEFGR